MKMQWHNNMSAVSISHQKKTLWNIDAVHVVGDKVIFIPIVSSNETILRNRG
jgi:hypothetical protein